MKNGLWRYFFKTFKTLYHLCSSTFLVIKVNLLSRFSLSLFVLVNLVVAVHFLKPSKIFSSNLVNLFTIKSRIHLTGWATLKSSLVEFCPFFDMELSLLLISENSAVHRQLMINSKPTYINQTLENSVDSDLSGQYLL